MIAENGGTAAAPDPVIDDFLALVRRAGEEGNAALPDLRAFLDRHPDLVGRFGDMAQSAQLAIIDRAVGGQPAMKEVMLRRAKELESGLVGADSSALEQLLSTHVVTSWLAANEAEMTAASAVNGRSIPLAHAEFLDRRRDRAGKRLESAAKTRALVRKLLLPAPSPLQVATRLGGRAARAATRPRTKELESVGVDN